MNIFIKCNCLFLKVDILNLTKFLLVIGLIIIGCIMIAKVYQEPKKNGSRAALWKKLTGATTPGRSKWQLAMHLIIKQLVFDVICFMVLDFWRDSEALKAGRGTLPPKTHNLFLFTSSFFLFFCSY